MTLTAARNFIVGLIDSPRDSDGDGMSDDYEKFYGFNPHNPADANLDADGDGLTNSQEFKAGANPPIRKSECRHVMTPWNNS